MQDMILSHDLSVSVFHRLRLFLLAVTTKKTALVFGATPFLHDGPTVSDLLVSPVFKLPRVETELHTAGEFLTGRV
jgi:hypothetical protein